MSREDPFGLSEGRERTRVRLTGTPPAPPAPMQMEPLAGAPLKRARKHPNMLVNVFSPLLEFAPELENAVAPGNPEVLRTRLHDELVRARDAAVANGTSLARADQAAWAVAALIDDLALNTPWGGASAWPRQPLVVMLRGDVDAGMQFFARLDELERHPNHDQDMLELHYVCLALGFRGKYRVPGRAGDRSLNAVRAAAARYVRNMDAGDAELSPHWRGVVAMDEPARFSVPVWVMAAVALVLSVFIYGGLSLRLSSQAEELTTLVRALPPPQRVEIDRVVPREPPVDAPPIEPVVINLIPEFQGRVPANLIGTLKGTESVSLARLMIQAENPELFRSARATLSEGFEPLVASIAQVIIDNQEVVGNITVVGHTDSVPLQRTNPFSTNQRLSEARAQTIADMLVSYGVPRERITSQGRAATDPIADNATREGKALNRRVEVLVEKRL